jgi:S-DNA-T family DNA segregation ATPase FtsK/SpoIIIE
VTEPGRAVAALDWLAGEMDERYRRMARLGVRNIDVFNNRVRHAHKRGEAPPRASEPSLAPMPYLVVVVDDLADLMPASRDEIEMAVQRLAPTARAAGIHLIVATRRPAPDVLTPAIKAVFQSRVCYKVASKAESRTVLDEPGAEQLLGQGDMLFSSGAGRIVRAHGAFVSDQEVGNIAAFLRGEGDR